MRGSSSTLWTATAIGPPLGGVAIGLFGPVTTVVIDAVSYLLSAAAIRAIGGSEPHPVRTDASRLRAGDLLEGWRTILTNPALRPLFFNTILVNGLIMATAPVIAVLMLGHLGFTPWQYGLAFGAPCIGGLIGARLARPLVARFGQHQVMLIAGALRACWPLGLAFIQPGAIGIILVIAVQFGLVICIGVFNPVFATYRLNQTATDRVARTLSAWSVTSSATIAVLTALWGLLASLTSPRIAIAIAGVLLLATPLLVAATRPRVIAGAGACSEPCIGGDDLIEACAGYFVRKASSRDRNARAYSAPVLCRSPPAEQATAASVTAPSSKRDSGSTDCRAINPSSMARAIARGNPPPKCRASISRQRSQPSTAGPSRRIIWPVASFAQAAK